MTVATIVCPGCDEDLRVVLDEEGRASGSCEYCGEAIAVVALRPAGGLALGVHEADDDEEDEDDLDLDHEEDLEEPEHDEDEEAEPW